MLHGEEFGGAGAAAHGGRVMQGRKMPVPCPSLSRVQGSWVGGRWLRRALGVMGTGMRALHGGLGNVGRGMRGTWGQGDEGGTWGGRTSAALCLGQSFNTYFSNEHSRLLTLWRQVVAFRRHFGEMKATTERSAGAREGSQGGGAPSSSKPPRHGWGPSLCLLVAGICRS